MLNIIPSNKNKFAYILNLLFVQFILVYKLKIGVLMIIRERQDITIVRSRAGNIIIRESLRIETQKSAQLIPTNVRRSLENANDKECKNITYIHFAKNYRINIEKIKQEIQKEYANDRKNASEIFTFLE